MADNLFKRGDIWWARIQVRGLDIRRSLSTSNRAEAKKRLAKVITEAEHYRHHGENRLSWKTAVTSWAEEAPQYLRPRTIARYLTSLRQVDPLLSDKLLDQIGRAEIVKIAKRKGITNATRRRDLTAVSVVLAFCVGQGWIEENEAKRYDRGAIKERREPFILPQLQSIELVAAAAPGNVAKAARFAQYTGMRQTEITTLEWHQINLKRAAAQLTETKTGQPRSVPLDDRAVGTIVGTVRHMKSPVVFYHGDGLAYLNLPTFFAKIVARVQAKAARDGIPFRRFKFHDLRHWFAVDYLRRGGSIYDLQKILGHSSIRTTEIYLTHLTPEEQARSKAGTNPGTGAAVQQEKFL